MITQYKIGDEVQWAYRNYGYHGAGTGDQIILSGEVVENSATLRFTSTMG